MMNWNHQCFCFCVDLQLPKFCVDHDNTSLCSLSFLDGIPFQSFAFIEFKFLLHEVMNLTYQLRRTVFSWQEMGDFRKYQEYRADGPRYECGTVSGENPQWSECMSPQTCC
jgi:hypothetical protein